MAAVRTLTTRLALLEVQLKELRRNVEKGARYGTQASSESLYRMWQAEREDNIRLRLLMEERAREYEAFRERVESGLYLLRDRVGEVVAKLSVAPRAVPGDDLDTAERKILEKFTQELQRGIVPPERLLDRLP